VTLPIVSIELIVSVSGIRDHTVPGLDDFREALARRSVPLSLFVAPRQSGGYLLEDDPATVEWLRRRRSSGDAVVLHGFDESPRFARLPAHEANLRIIAADRILEQLGLRTRIFAAPGWTTSPGTARVLPRNGFRLLVGAHAVVDLVRGTTVSGRILGRGAGLLSEPWWGRAVVLGAQRTARRGGTVRLAVPATLLGRPGVSQALLDATDLALLHGCRPGVYRWPPGPLLRGAA
jgi:uncharacterized protein